MATMTIYMDDETQRLVEAAAKRSGSSVSGWARGHLLVAAKGSGGWPEGYFDRLAGFGETSLEDPGEVEVEVPLDTVEL